MIAKRLFLNHSPSEWFSEYNKLGAAALSAGCTQLSSYVIYFSVCTPNLDHTLVLSSSFGIIRANLKRVFYKTAYSQSK